MFDIFVTERFYSRSVKRKSGRDDGNGYRGGSSGMKTPQVGVGVIIVKDDQVLLLKRKSVHGKGTWSPPGGHLEFGESPETCALREAYEETAVTVADMVFKGITNDVFHEAGKHYVTLWFEGRYAAGEAIVNAPYEASEVKWWAWDALPAPLFLSFQNLLDGQGYQRRA